MTQSTAAVVAAAAHVKMGAVKMPKFYRQNKKRIDPRYFLNETTNRDLDEEFQQLLYELEFKGLTKNQRREREEELGYDPDYVDGEVEKYGPETYVSRVDGQPRPDGRSKEKGFDLRKVAPSSRTGIEGKAIPFNALMDMSDDQLIKIYSLLKGQNIGPTKAAAEAQAILNTPKSDLAAAESGRSRLAFMIQDMREKREAN